VNTILKETRLASREANLNTMTKIENYERKFIRSDIIHDVDDQLRHQLLVAYQDYLRTIPEKKREASWSYQVKKKNSFFHKCCVLFRLKILYHVYHLVLDLQEEFHIIS
jgi:6-phosphogluconate dehydrogenase